MSEKPAETAGDEPTGRAPRRIGVYICHCGGNISDYVDVEAVREAVRPAGAPSVRVPRVVLGVDDARPRPDGAGDDAGHRGDEFARSTSRAPT